MPDGIIHTPSGGAMLSVGGQSAFINGSMQRHGVKIAEPSAEDKAKAGTDYVARHGTVASTGHNSRGYEVIDGVRVYSQAINPAYAELRSNPDMHPGSLPLWMRWREGIPYKGPPQDEAPVAAASAAPAPASPEVESSIATVVEKTAAPKRKRGNRPTVADAMSKVDDLADVVGNLAQIIAQQAKPDPVQEVSPPVVEAEPAPPQSGVEALVPAFAPVDISITVPSFGAIKTKVDWIEISNDEWLVIALDKTLDRPSVFPQPSDGKPSAVFVMQVGSAIFKLKAMEGLQFDFGSISFTLYLILQQDHTQ